MNEHRNCRPLPHTASSVSQGRGLRICLSDQSQVLLVLLTWGPRWEPRGRPRSLGPLRSRQQAFEAAFRGDPHGSVCLSRALFCSKPFFGSDASVTLTGENWAMPLLSSAHVDGFGVVVDQSRGFCTFPWHIFLTSLSTPPPPKAPGCAPPSSGWPCPHLPVWPVPYGVQFSLCVSSAAEQSLGS